LFEKMSCFLMKWQVCGKYFPDEFLWLILPSCTKPRKARKIFSKKTLSVNKWCIAYNLLLWGGIYGHMVKSTLPAIAWLQIKCTFALRLSNTSWNFFSFFNFQNDLVHGWGMDMKLGYCAQVCRTWYFWDYFQFLWLFSSPSILGSMLLTELFSELR
jgi:hypothetical protein